jgi:hypothetical protein
MGIWLLAIGGWLLAIGYWQLAVGNAIGRCLSREPLFYSD